MELGLSTKGINCQDCSNVKKNMDKKILEKTNILQECLMILRKTMITWEKQLNESDLDISEIAEVKTLL